MTSAGPASLPGYAESPFQESTTTPGTPTAGFPDWPSGGGSLPAPGMRQHFTLDVNFTDGKSHTLSMYLLDWERAADPSKSRSWIRNRNGPQHPKLLRLRHGKFASWNSPAM